MPAAELGSGAGSSVGLLWDNGKENGNYRDYRGYRVYIGVIWGLYNGFFRV